MKHHKFAWLFRVLIAVFMLHAGASNARYVQADPIGIDGGLNPLIYADDNPLSATDPEGLQARPPRGAGAFQPVFPSLGIRPPTTPVGRSGSPLEVRPGTNTRDEVGGREFSGHALDRMQERGIPPSAVTNTVLTGQRSPGSTPNTTQHYDPVNNVTVISNATTGNIVTVRNGPPKNICP